MPLITPPAAEPLTLAQVKAHLRIDADITDDDTLLASLIPAARGQAEHRTRRRFGVQTWQRVLDAFPSGPIILPDPPVAAVTSITYDDTAGTPQTLDPAAYRARTAGEPASIRPVTSWPATLAEEGAVRITYTCGITSADPRWPALLAWMLLAIGTWYANREALIIGAAVAELPRDFWAGLLDPLIFYGTPST